jgi:small-conductance mechanosensitive channel
MKDTKVIARPQVRVGAKVEATSEISRAGIYTVGIASVLIGIWGLACFVGGMITSGGPLALVADWFKAVTGI